MGSVCVASEICRSVLHHCVVILVCFSGIIVCMFINIWHNSSAHALGASLVLHLTVTLMNSINKTEAATLLCKPCFLGAFPFIGLMQPVTGHRKRCYMFYDWRTHVHHSAMSICLMSLGPSECAIINFKLLYNYVYDKYVFILRKQSQ